MGTSIFLHLRRHFSYHLWGRFRIHKGTQELRHLKSTQIGSQKGNHAEQEEIVAKISRGKFHWNKKAVIAVAIIYSFLLCFMIKMIGMGGTVSFILFLGICSLPSLLARVLGDKGQVSNDDDPGGYRYIYSYRYGSRFGSRVK